MFKTFSLAVAICLFSAVAHADTVAVVNFDNLPTGPSLFGGPEQTVTPVAGVATFSGGTVLGFATNFPAIVYATAPNVYGSYGPGYPYSSTITITIDPAFLADEVSFALFNGEGSSRSYVVDAFSGVNLVGSQNFTNLPANSSSGYGLVDLLASNITTVTITPTDTSSWDFLIDTVAFNESIDQAVNPAVPEPSSLLLLGTGLAGAASQIYRRVRRAA